MSTKLVIQLSYNILGAVDTSLAVAPAPLRITPVDAGFRLTGLWPHRDLAAARRQVASVLAQLPPETAVRCNFTGREHSALHWITMLQAPLTVAGVFEARHALVEGRVFARLFGAYQLGESDIVLVADAATDVAEVYRFLTAWASFRLTSSEDPAWDRPFPWGYWLVSFAEHDAGDADFWTLLRESLGTAHLRDAFDERMHAPAPHLVIEADDPGDADTSYMIGGTHALRIAERQRATVTRLGALEHASPSAQDAAGFCDRLGDAFDSGTGVPCFAYREAPKSPLDSGWRFACLDPEHAHDAASLRIAPLGRTAVVPGLVDYLSLPPGWVVTWEDGGFWTNAPGEAESHLDSGPETHGR